MWIVFRKDTLEIVFKFYSKKTAKEFMAANKENRKRFGMDKIDNLDALHIEKWKTWTALKQGLKHG